MATGARPTGTGRTHKEPPHFRNKRNQTGASSEQPAPSRRAPGCVRGCVCARTGVCVCAHVCVCSSAHVSCPEGGDNISAPWARGV